MRTGFLATALSAVLLAGCGGGSDSGPSPPEILYGEDICDHCRMVISEERHAAASLRDGREYRFDDPGCLRGFDESATEAGDAIAWVHDENSRWLRTEDAWFVTDPSLVTPMGSGIVAFGSAAAAMSAAQRYEVEAGSWVELDSADEPPGP